MIDSGIWRNTQEAEGTPLERVQVVNSGAMVQIPLSPFQCKKYFFNYSKKTLTKYFVCCILNKLSQKAQ